MSGRHGAFLVIGSLAAIALFLGVSAAIAPPGSAGTASDNLLVGVQGPGHQGAIEAFDYDGNRQWRRSDAASYHSVSRLDDGRILAAFVVESQNASVCGDYETPCGVTGFRVFKNQTLVREWSFTVRSVPNSEVHDVERLPSGEMLVADMDRERIMTVNQSGAVTWSWYASEYYDAPADPTRQDWLHINDVDRIGDGRYLVSVRNTNQLLIIERGSGVVEVVNEERDTGVIRQQHNPQWLGEGAILVADSENYRIVELHRLESGDWEVTWSVSRANGLAFNWPRDADRLPNGNTVITDSRNNRVVAVNSEGDAVWQIATSSLPYEADVAGGELIGAPQFQGDGGEVRDGVPIFGTTLNALSHLIPLPYWLTPWHLAGVTAGISGVVAGLWELGIAAGRRFSGCDDSRSRDEMGERPGTDSTITNDD